jgi:hypothetical protein
MSKSEDKRKEIQSAEWRSISLSAGGFGSVEPAEMVVDIVERLRQELPCWCDAEPTRVEVRDMCWEASAEIERLRKAITDFIIKTSDSHCTWQMENDAIEELKKELRDE